MPADARLLTMAQWLSPAFPLSAYAYSHGLESAVAAGWVRDAAALENWLEDVLRHGTGRCDAIWLRLAHDAPDGAALRALDASARAFVPAAERLDEAASQGAAFARTTSQVWELDVPELLLPLAVGRAARLRALEIDAVVPLFLHAFAANLVAAAQRLMPLGQVAGQRIVAALQPVCLDVAAGTRGATLDDITSVAFASDIAAMRHETLQPRIFRS